MHRWNSPSNTRTPCLDYPGTWWLEHESYVTIIGCCIVLMAMLRGRYILIFPWFIGNDRLRDRQVHRYQSWPSHGILQGRVMAGIISWYWTHLYRGILRKGNVAHRQWLCKETWMLTCSSGSNILQGNSGLHRAGPWVWQDVLMLTRSPGVPLPREAVASIRLDHECE